MDLNFEAEVEDMKRQVQESISIRLDLTQRLDASRKASSEMHKILTKREAENKRLTSRILRHEEDSQRLQDELEAERAERLRAEDLANKLLEGVAEIQEGRQEYAIEFPVDPTQMPILYSSEQVDKQQLQEQLQQAQYAQQEVPHAEAAAVETVPIASEPFFVAAAPVTRGLPVAPVSSLPAHVLLASQMPVPTVSYLNLPMRAFAQPQPIYQPRTTAVAVPRRPNKSARGSAISALDTPRILPGPVYPGMGVARPLYPTSAALRNY
eukprot:NODE_2795_length_1119_cov_30.569159_g2566_i0.p1 GENE.NODE_2795_length_1119_cov_30.569159_g2566_i0~~NODE_2795_length_1119_cov_30.569159_g2566_i0.p1  ORF type:complete len:298 (-),score=50.15 NODE_2795_length_1119_cov_30.569159_g2566_i0:226-1026(-)